MIETEGRWQKCTPISGSIVPDLIEALIKVLKTPELQSALAEAVGRDRVGDDDVFNSPVVETLSDNAYNMLCCIRFYYNNGDNEPPIPYPDELLCDDVECSPEELAAASQELQDRKLIRYVHGEYPGWIITFLPMEGYPATTEWQEWEPEPKKGGER